jgi:hypothetical protein
MSDDFDAAGFKAVCAALGIETRVITDAFGRPDVAIDRDGLNKLIRAGLLPEDPSGLPGFQALMEKRRKERGESP